tara:strand:- start:144 stop:797 length:654 start_codon:yes stop_codon:yes gene_type:complete
MALSTYSDLKTSVANYLNRDDLTNVIPDFITLAESRLNRELRVRVNMVRAETTTAANIPFYNLPSDLIELRNITYESDSTTSYALSYLSPESGSREWGAYTSGLPRAYTNLGLNIKIYPIPDAAYVIGINYFKKLVPLSNTQTTNDIIANFPDLYLFASCLEGAIYLNDTEQTQRFGSIFAESLNSVKEAEEKARYSGTVMHMTVQGDPGSLVRRGA